VQGVGSHDCVAHRNTYCCHGGIAVPSACLFPMPAIGCSCQPTQAASSVCCHCCCDCCPCPYPPVPPQVLSGSVFLHAGSRVMSGSEEGLLGWVAVNYASGALQVCSLGCVCGRHGYGVMYNRC
jgi:hypothetical protein